MSLDISTNDSLYHGLKSLVGRKLVVVTYGNPENPDNIAIEDEVAGEIIISANCPNKKYIIPAEVHSDDYVYSIEFDALEWFMQANDEDIQELQDYDFGGDYPSDDIALFQNNLDIKNLFAYIEKQNIGFECRVNKEAAIKWVKENRPGLLV